MAVRRDKRGKWRYRKVIKLHDGSRLRIFGTPNINTKEATEQAERDRIRLEEERARTPPALRRTDAPTFAEWFNGRFWLEHVAENSPGEKDNKLAIYENHLSLPFAAKRLDAIRAAEVATFRASLLASGLRPKTINNVLTVLRKALTYAVDVEVLAEAPRIRLTKAPQEQIDWWTFQDYTRLLRAAAERGPQWYVAVCLCGEAGLRVGEVKALRWREDVDLVAGTITVNQQVRRGRIGPPKGRRSRTVPMTDRLLAALRSLDQIRTGYVVRNLDGTLLSDSQARHGQHGICRAAGLPVRGWHALRHSFGTHAALFGANPWRLQAWLGHTSIDVTMRYVHLAQHHLRSLPPEIVAAGARETDPDRRVLAMLSARGNDVATAAKKRAK